MKILAVRVVMIFLMTAVLEASRLSKRIQQDNSKFKRHLLHNINEKLHSKIIIPDGGEDARAIDPPSEDDGDNIIRRRNFCDHYSW